MSRWSILLCAVAATFFSTVSTGCKNGGGAENLGIFILPQNVVSISSVIPNIGSTLGGNNITIIGSNFVPSTVNNVGSFTTAKIGNTVLINVAVPNTFTLTGTIPAGNYTAGSTSVSVITSQQTATLPNGYTFATMSVTAVTPNNGPITGNIAIVISGTNFFGIAPSGVVLQGTGANAGTIVNLENVVVDPLGNFITALVPSGLPLGGYQLIITSSSFGTVNFGTLYTVGSGLSTTLLITNVRSQPGNVSPAHGPLAGGTTVTLTASIQPPATGFIPNNGINVTLIFPGGQTLNATNIVISSVAGPNDTCTFTTPAVPGSFSFFGGPTTVRVDSTTQGFALAADGFSYDAASTNPIINTISPAQGPQGGGTLVTIEGVNFQSGVLSNVRAVFIGGNPLLGLAIQTQNQLTGFTPPGLSGFQPVTIVGSNGSVSTTVQFNYLPSVVLTKLDPNQGPVGGGNLVTVLGANFTTATVISGSLTVGGNAVQDITIINSSTLTGIVPPSGAGPGPVDVVVAANGGLLGMTLRLAYTYGPSFDAPQSTAVSLGAPALDVQTVTLGNANGSLCAVTVNGADNSLTIVQNVGVPGGPFNTIYVQNAAITGSPLNNPIDVKVVPGMEKGGGLPDLVILNNVTGLPGAQQVVVLHNNLANSPPGAPFTTIGTFAVNTLPNFVQGGGSLQAVSIDVADVNNDGHPDVAVLGSSTVAGVVNGVGIFFGSPAGTGALQTINPSTGLAGKFAALGAGDVGAVKLKLVGVPNQGLLGELTDAFSNAQPPDIAGSGNPDIIALCKVSATLCPLLNDGIGDFTLVATGSVSVGAPNPVSFDASDIDQNGTLDVVTANLGVPGLGQGSISIILGDGAGAFQQTAIYSVPNAGIPVGKNNVNFSSIIIGDVNFDCRKDVVVSNFDGTNISVFLGNGDGSFAVPVNYIGEAIGAAANANIVAIAGVEQTNGLQFVVCADKQAVGQPNSLVAVVPRHVLDLYFGAFQKAPNPIFQASSNGLTPDAVVFGDINNDGRPDMVVVNRASNSLSVYIGDGTGNFTQPFPSIPFNQNTQPESVVIARVDLTSEAPSVLVALQASNQIALLRNFGGGSLASPVYIPVDGTGPHAIICQDMNGDGKLDIVTVNQASNDVSILLGDGTGNFAPALSSPYPVGNAPLSFVIQDLNADNLPDLAVANFASDDVTVLLQTPGSATATDVKFGASSVPLNGSFVTNLTGFFSLNRGPVEPRSIAVGDLNGDTAPDLVTCDESPGTCTILHAKCQATITFTNASVAPAIGDTLVAAVNSNVFFVGADNYFGTVTAVAGAAPNVTVTIANIQGGGIPDPIFFNVKPFSPLLPGCFFPGDFFFDNQNPNFNATLVALANGNSPISNIHGTGQFFPPTLYTVQDVTADVIGFPPVVFPVLKQPSVVKIFDMNNDGFLDIVVASEAGATVANLINQGQADQLAFGTVGVCQNFFLAPLVFFVGFTVSPAGEFNFISNSTFGLFPSEPHEGYPVLSATAPILGPAVQVKFIQATAGQALGMDIAHITLDCPPSIAVVSDANVVQVFKSN